MLTFSLSGTALRIAGAKRDVVIFPQSDAPSEDLLLLEKPQERPVNGIISWPGEYDVAGITVRGIGHDEGQRVSFMVEADGIRCAFPCSPLHDWADEDVEKLGDIVVLAIRGDEEPRKVQKLVDDIDPRILFLLPGKDGAIQEELRKICGAQGREPVSEYKVKSSLPTEGRDVAVFA